jgi:hypothetical protein
MPAKRSPQTPSLLDDSGADRGDTDSEFVARTKLGYPLDEAISTLQKCVRRGREREAMYWTCELIQSGYVRYFWRRLMIIASEECSADLDLCCRVGQLAQNAALTSKDFSGRVEGILEAQAVLALCRCPSKSREACDAFGYMHFARQAGFRITPHGAGVDMHTKRGREMGKGFVDFATEGRYVAGVRGRNDYEKLLWGREQDPVDWPSPSGDPDIDLPPLTVTRDDKRGLKFDLPEGWLDTHPPE